MLEVGNQVQQKIIVAAQRFGGFEGCASVFVCLVMSTVDPMQCNVSALVAGAVVANWFAKLFGIRSSVQYIIDDLKGQAEVVTNRCYLLQLRCCGLAKTQPHR